MIKDAKGRKWMMRFKLYQQGWHWEACWRNSLSQSSKEFFESRAAALADARRVIQRYDLVAQSREFFSRLQKRGTECRLTSADWDAIEQAGADKKRTQAAEREGAK